MVSDESETEEIIRTFETEIGLLENELLTSMFRFIYLEPVTFMCNLLVITMYIRNNTKWKLFWVSFLYSAQYLMPLHE